MRQIFGLMLAVTMLAGCGGSEVDAPEVSIEDADWSGSEIAIETVTNLPDGAILSWYVLEGDDWDDLDAADTQGFATVADGSATVTADVSGFAADDALVEVTFVPSYNEQPADVTGMYEANEGAAVEVSVSR